MSLSWSLCISTCRRPLLVLLWDNTKGTILTTTGANPSQIFYCFLWHSISAKSSLGKFMRSRVAYFHVRGLQKTIARIQHAACPLCSSILKKSPAIDECKFDLISICKPTLQVAHAKSSLHSKSTIPAIPELMWQSCSSNWD